MRKVINRLKIFDVMLMVVVLACYFWWFFSKSDYYKNNFTPEFRNPNALLKIIEEIPSGPGNSGGSKEIKIGDRIFIIPNSIISSFGVRNERQNFMRVMVLWPSMKAPKNRRFAGIDVVDIKLEARKDIPRSASRSELEHVISDRHGNPVLLSKYTDLQEYPNRNYFPFYRAKDASAVWADGLPTYFYCGGLSISQQGPGGVVSHDGRCVIELIWPDSFTVEISFHKSHLAKWREIHDSTMEMLNSMEKNPNLSRGSLLNDN